jgi:NAD-dependent deacetylase
MSAWLSQWCQAFMSGQGALCVLTGAGISAESGIPTFRGKDGYWTKGSAEETPEAMATYSMLRRNPETFWIWYLSRFASCIRAQPNAGHLALVELQNMLGDRFILITQNIDGLHLRAGSDPKRLFRVHGDMYQIRCSRACQPELWPLPALAIQAMGQPGFEPKALLPHLHCPHCEHWARPHVLLFDEYYDENWYRFQSSLMAVQSAHSLLTIGTTGATQLPSLMLERAVRRGIPILDVNVEANVFADAAENSQGGGPLKGPAGERLPQIVAALKAAATRSS